MAAGPRSPPRRCWPLAGAAVTALDVRDSAALEAALEAQPEGCWVEVTVAGERLVVVRVPGGWHLAGDRTVASADVVEGRPTRVDMLGDDGRLPVAATIERSRGAFPRARAEQDWEEPEVLTAELDDRASVGWVEAGALRDEIDAWLCLYGDDPGDPRGADASRDGVVADPGEPEAAGSAGRAYERRQRRGRGPRPGEGR